MPARRLSALVRHYARLVAFSLPPVHQLIERPRFAPPDLRVVFDQAWSSTTQSTDLEGTVTIDQTAATVANLIRYRLPEYPKVLDVGCAGGTLAGELPPSVHYLGIDVNESAIEAAQSLWGGDDILFVARDIREEFLDPVGNWDAIVFSEVLSLSGPCTRPSLRSAAMSPGAFAGGHSRHHHDERRKEPRDLGARFAPRVSMDRRHSLAAKGAVATPTGSA